MSPEPPAAAFVASRGDAVIHARVGQGGWGANRGSSPHHLGGVSAPHRSRVQATFLLVCFFRVGRRLHVFSLLPADLTSHHLDRSPWCARPGLSRCSRTRSGSEQLSGRATDTSGSQPKLGAVPLTVWTPSPRRRSRSTPCARTAFHPGTRTPWPNRRSTASPSSSTRRPSAQAPRPCRPLR
jgi:hypothetical protein